VKVFDASSSLVVIAATTNHCYYYYYYYYKKSKGKGAYSSLRIENPSQSYGASPAIWDHTVLPAT